MSVTSRPPKPTRRGTPAKAEFTDDGPTSIYEGAEQTSSAPATVSMRSPHQGSAPAVPAAPVVPSDPPKPAPKIVTISMKTPADPNLKPVVPEREMPHIKLRAMSEMSRSAIPLNLGNLAPPYDPEAARKRTVREYLVWASIAVMLACAIALVVWFVAT